MRTTIRLPDELYTEVRVRAASSGATVTSFIEESLRAALRRHEDASSLPAYVVEPFSGGVLAAGVDLDDSAALLDVMAGDARV